MSSSKSRIACFVVLLMSVFCQQSVNAQTVLKIKKFDTGAYALSGIVNGLAMFDIMIDTGATDFSISPKEAAFMLKNGYLSVHNFRDQASYLTPEGEIREGIKIVIGKIELMGIVLTDVEATVSEPRKESFMLGQSFLKGLGRLEFDYSDETLTIYSATGEGKSKQTQVSPAVPGERDGLKPPVLLEGPVPRYTKEAKKAGIEGISLIQAIIRKDGSVGGCNVLRRVGYGLDEAAADIIARKWLFKPGFFNGVPVDAQANIEVNFKLY